MKVSVIIPVFNVEKYLERCLNDIRNQTFQNIEVIVANDGSTDRCPEICEIFARMDERFTVINKKNGGLSDARNAAMKLATGDFMVFVDSDDRVSVDFIQKLYETVTENNADIAECNVVEFSEDAEIHFKSNNDSSKKIYTAEKAMEALMLDELKQVVWNKIYKREMITADFENGKIHEDEFWTPIIFANAQKIVKTDAVLYFYRKTEESIMGKSYSLKRLDGLEALRKRIDLVKEKFPLLENLAVRRFCTASFVHYQKLTEKPELDPNKNFRYKILVDVMPFNNKETYKNWMPRKKFWFKFFLFSPDFCVKLRLFLGIGPGA